jgi:hypothetical protein
MPSTDLGSRVLSWRPSEASCTAPEEVWDEMEEETLRFADYDSTQLKEGDYADVWCDKNKVGSAAH